VYSEIRLWTIHTEFGPKIRWKNSPGRTRRRWEDNIKTDFNKMGLIYEVPNRIEVAQVRIYLR
jgi:hypothetical protein